MERLTVKISALVTSKVTAEYEVESEDEALRMFRLFHPDAEIEEVYIEPVGHLTASG